MNIGVNKVKILVTVPPENTEEVRNAVCNAGAGIIGEYSYCTTCVKSVETFIPNDNAKHVIAELRKVHPYEKPAIDIVPLIDENSLV